MRESNRKFAELDKVFRKACEITKWINPATGKLDTLMPTKRQASKWRNSKGLAKRMHGTAASLVKRVYR